MSKVFFISGHRDITEEEFKKYYEEKIFNAINQDANFVVGDYYGVDDLAQKYLKAMMVDKCKVRVYHMFEEPRNNCGWLTVGDFTSDEERDSAMTYASDFDIAWVRPGKEKSGTARNLQRRKEYQKTI